MVKDLIVENEGLFRDMLKISLGAIPNLEIVGAVCDGNAAIQATGQMRPEVVLMDIESGSDPNGIEVGKAIMSNHPDMGVILLSAHKEREYVSLIASDADALVRAIEGAACGLVVMDQGGVTSMKPRKGSDTAGLTSRQQEILSMMAKGYNNSAIDDNLVLGTKSVENYINAIYQELHLGHNGDLHPRVQVRSSLTSATPPSGIPGG